MRESRASKTKRPPLRAAVLILERARRFERPTLTLARLCSTPELRPHSVVWVLLAQAEQCKRDFATLLAKAKGRHEGALSENPMERARRFERPTLTLARLCSTPELRPHRSDGREISEGRGPCKGKNAPLGRIYPRTAAAASIRLRAMKSNSALLRRVGSRTSHARINMARVCGNSGAGPRNSQFQKARALPSESPKT